MTALDFPTAPSNGDTYQNYVYDSTAGVWKRLAAGLDLNDITDVTLTSPTDGQALVYDNATSNWVNGEGSTVPVLISETAPVSPEVGELWLNSTEAKMYVYYDDGTSAQWVAAVGGTVPQQGKILQVVSTTKTDTETISTGTFTAISGLSASITPSSASNKVLIMVSLYGSGGTTGSSPSYRLTGGNSGTYIGDAGSASQGRVAAVGPHNPEMGGSTNNVSTNIIFLDSPATTSSVTYGVEWSRGSSGTAYIGRTVANSDNVDNSRTAASITVMEVAG